MRQFSTNPVVDKRRRRVLKLADGTRTQEQIAVMLGVSRESITADMAVLRAAGLNPVSAQGRHPSVDRGGRPKGGADERRRNRIAEMWPKLPVHQIAQRVGIPQKAVRMLAMDMGLGPEFVAEVPEVLPWPEVRGMTPKQIAWARKHPGNLEARLILGMAEE